MRRPKLCILSAAFLAALTLPLAAQDVMRPQEAARLDRYDAIVGDALMQAMAAGKPTDIAALNAALSGPPQIAFDPSMAGDWSCRTLKLGGLSGLTVYTKFKCRITATPTGFNFEKLTGSQRTSGVITLREGRAIYLGVGYVSDGTPIAYDTLVPDFRGDGSILPQVAVFERVSQSRARLIFPAPIVESDMDILELTR